MYLFYIHIIVWFSPLECRDTVVTAKGESLSSAAPHLSGIPGREGAWSARRHLGSCTSRSSHSIRSSPYHTRAEEVQSTLGSRKSDFSPEVSHLIKTLPDRGIEGGVEIPAAAIAYHPYARTPLFPRERSQSHSVFASNQATPQ